MFRVRFVSILLLLCFLAAGGSVLAAEVDCDAAYCFSAEDFSQEEALRGICITKLPDASTGTVMLGSRVLQPGDILTAGQLQRMTFHPLRTQQDVSAVVTYLPVFQDRVAPSTTMTISIRGKQDQSPVAQDSTLETYKNLPNSGTLKVTDPEGEALTYSVVRQPKRGQVEISADGVFTYTPKKNKVGVDSFTFTAADPAGNVSREATVTVQILKPTDAKQYADTLGQDCRFAAEWMRNTGLFVGEKVGGENCFFPQKAVSRGEFLTMVVKALDIPVEQTGFSGLPEDAPDWLKPYLAAAQRSGLTAGWPATESGDFEADAPITGAEAAVMLQNALDLTVTQQTVETALQQEESAVPTWAESSLTVLAENGVILTAGESMTRADTAQVLYQISQLAVDAPGMAVIRMQQ